MPTNNRVPASTSSPDSPLTRLYLLGPEPNDVHGIAVDAESLYWKQASSSYMRAPKDGSGSPELILQCLLCSGYELHPVGRYFYAIDPQYVYQVNLETKRVRQVSLPWDLSTARMFADTDHVYVALRGCPAIARINHESFTFDDQTDVFYIDDVPAPRRGYVRLTRGTRSGSTAAAPQRFSRLTRGTSRRVKLYAEVNDLFGLLAINDHIYWLEDDTATDAHPAIGWIPIDGGVATRATLGSGGKGTLVYASTINRLLYNSITRIGGIEPDKTEFDVYFRPDGNIRDVAVDADFAYLSIVGGLEGENGFSYWLSRVPLSALPGSR